MPATLGAAGRVRQGQTEAVDDAVAAPEPVDDEPFEEPVDVDEDDDPEESDDPDDEPPDEESDDAPLGTDEPERLSVR